MIIKKEYKIAAMCEELKATMEEATKKNKYCSFCEIGILFLRDILDVLEEVKEREEKTLVFAELENGTKTSGYYSTEEAGKALKKTIEEINKKSCFGNYQDVYMCTHCIDCEKCREETDKTKKSEDKNCKVDNKDVPEYLQQKCDECFYKDYKLCGCKYNSGEGFCPFRPLCFTNYGRDNIAKCIGCAFGEECEFKSNKKAPSKKEPKLREEWEERVKHAEKCYARYEVEKSKEKCDIEFDEEDICCQWCDGFL